MCDLAQAHVDCATPVESLTVRFQSGESVTFTILNATVTAMSIRIGKSAYSVPRSVCAKLHDIRFTSVMFGWDGSYKTSATADYFYIYFDMGLETAKRFGQLPQVWIMFNGGKFQTAYVRKMIAKGESQGFDL